ncbi:MAG: 5-nucleotidase [Firmicutes bacterium]|nr:5-nucleotidase [Bacillota bacterium]
MVFTKKISVFIAAVCIAMACLGSVTLAAEAATEQERIDIFSVNDFHGALSENGKNPGMPKLAGFLREEIAKNPAGTILVSAGDMFQGTPESNLLYGKPVVETMNELGFAAMALGNHEFDWGIPVLQERIAQSKFPYLAANIIDKATGKSANFVKPYSITERKGIKIAIIGLATPETATKTNPKYSKNYVFSDPVKTVNRLVPELKQQGANIIIILSHLGSEMDEAQKITGEAADLVRQVTGISAVVSGHTHRKVAGTVNSIPIVQAAYNGRAVGKISLYFSKSNKEVINTEYKVVELSPNNLVPDKAVQAIVDKVQQEVAPVKNKVLGNTTSGLEHEKFTHSVLGQWVADTMRHQAKADIAFENGGGLRTGIPAGTITLGTLYQVVPFDNTLVTVELTGQQVVEVLAHGIYNKQIGMVQFSGIQVEYDISLPAAKKIVKVTLPDGSNLNLTKTYKVVTNDFMAQGGDGFTMFSQGQHLLDTQIPLRDCLVETIVRDKQINHTLDQRFREVVPATAIHQPAA